MDLKMLLSGIDLDGMQTHLKEIIEMVKNENKNVTLLEGENNVYILLDVKKEDVIIYRITTGIIKIDEKNYLEIKRTLGKWGLSDLKNLIGEGSSSIENKLRKILPIVNGVISLIKLKENEKRVSIQLDIKGDDIKAYQVVLGVYGKKETGLNLVVNRVLEKYNLNEYITKS